MWIMHTHASFICYICTLHEWDPHTIFPSSYFRLKPTHLTHRNMLMQRSTDIRDTLHFSSTWSTSIHLYMYAFKPAIFHAKWKWDHWWVYIPYLFLIRCILLLFSRDSTHAALISFAVCQNICPNIYKRPVQCSYHELHAREVASSASRV